MTSIVEPVFDQSSAGSNLYWLNGGGLRAGFRASGAIAFEATVTLTQSWADGGGLWFWLDTAPADPSTFAAALAAYLEFLPPATGPRALWISGVATGIAQWRSDAVDMIRVGQITTVDTGTIFETGSIRVMIGSGNTVTVGEYTDDFRGWGFSLSGDPGLVFVTGDGRLSAAQGRSGFSYGAGQVGCLIWTLDLTTNGQDPSGLAELGASLRFFGPDPLGEGTIRVLQVDVLRQTAAVTLFCCFDPLAPLDPARTRFGLLPFNATIAQVPSFETGYVTARGYGVTLAPRNVASPTPTGFVFGVQPLVSGVVDRALVDVPVVYYLTPDGDFDLSVPGKEGGFVAAARLEGQDPAPVERLLCGTTGLDYVGLPAASGMVLSFRAGNAAYAPPNTDATPDARNTPGTEDAPAALTTLGTTAWSWISGGGALGYYAQPEDAPFYTGGKAGFLDYLEISAATLTTEQSAPAFPMVGYAGLQAAQGDFAREIEARGVAPERRRQIAWLTDTQWMPAALRGAPAALPSSPIPAVTPPGLAIGYAGDKVPWAWLAIGNTGASSDGLPDMRFTAVDGAFRQAVLSNRLFMVLGDAKAVLANGSVAYQLTRSSLGLIKALPPPPKGVPPAVYDAVAKAVAGAGYPVYPTETAFNDMLKDATKAIGGITPEQMLIFQRFAGLLSPAIGDWLFRMSPRNWAAPDRVGPKNARLIFKFVGGRTLAELVADTAAWSWPEASSEDGKASTARDDIQSIIRSAREASAAAKAKNQTSPYEPFLKVVDNPYWSGVLALSVEVPLDSLPEPLQPLAAGIDPKSFYAHHLGLTATSFTSASEKIKFDVTSSFGLIDYQNPIDQYFSSDIAFAFQVQQLTVGFENGKLSSFTSSAQLMVNRLFGTDTRLFPSEHGNNIILDGVYQTERNDGGGQRDTYVFAMRNAGAFQLALGALLEVGVEQTRLATVRAADPASGNTTVTGAFQMTGRLRFVEPEKFDPFCWGPPAATPDPTGQSFPADETVPDTADSKGLLYSNYTITMSFPLSDPANVKFTVADGAIAFDTANSPARPNSLFARFPLRLTGLLATPDPKVMGGEASTRDPAAAGFVSVSAPLQQGKLSQPWYGLVYEVDLGTLGALAGSVGLTVRLLAAWSPAGGDKGLPAVYFGVALPGVEKMLGVSLPLQGILDIGFRTIQFTTYDDVEGRRQYLMRLRDFGLHVLGLSFPPGHNDITVFGNPNQTSNTKLGWYAAYDNGKSDGKKPTAQATSGGTKRRRLPSQETERLIRAARPPRQLPSSGNEK
jgi:hypothetical protein